MKLLEYPRKRVVYVYIIVASEDRDERLFLRVRIHGDVPKLTPRWSQ